MSLHRLLLAALVMSLALGTAAADSPAGDDAATGQQPETRYFAFFHLPGPAWDPEKRVFQQDWSAHLDYMHELTAEGLLVLGGPFKDDSGAFGIFDATTLEEARALAEADPAVQSGLVTVEVRPWHPVVLRPMESRPW